MSKLGEKIKEIRLKEGLSQEAFAKELGYNSRSTINKIEKGINEISYEKLMLLVKKYELELDELFDRPHKESFSSSNKESILFVSFSGRDNGNCNDIAHYLINENDKLILFKDIFYNPCSKCNYECVNSICKYRYDDVYDLIESTNNFKKIVFIVPMYCGNPSSLYFILNERMQDYFIHNEDKWNSFTKKLYFICIYGSDEETPLFINYFYHLVNDSSKILKIERHKYNLKMNDKILDNKDLIKLIDDFKWKLC
jgi:transcriptional regulator with XRE-family HTH domain